MYNVFSKIIFYFIAIEKFEIDARKYGKQRFDLIQIEKYKKAFNSGKNDELAIVVCKVKFH